jgi:hypothetical protein
MDTSFDYFFNDRTNPKTIEALRSGPLASSLETYAQRLYQDGDAIHSGFLQLRLLGAFNGWLDRKGFTCGDVGPATIEQFLSRRAQTGTCAKAILPRCFGF